MRLLFDLMNVPDAVVLRINNEEVINIDSHASRSIQAGVDCRSTVATKATSAIAGNCSNSPPRADLPDALVAVVSDKQVAARVEDNSNRTVQAGARGRPAVTAETHSAVAGYSCDVPAMDLADALVAEVGDKEVFVGVNGHCNRELEACADRCSVVAAEARSAVARNRGYGAIGNTADAMVECVSDKEIAPIVGNHAVGKVQASAGRHAAIAAEASCTVAANSGDSAGSIYFSDAVVECVGDKQVAVVIDGHCLRDIQARDAGGPVVAAEVSCAVTRHSGDRTREFELADAVIEGIGDEQVVVAVHCHPDGKIQAGAGDEATVTAVAGEMTSRNGADDRPSGREHRKELGIKGN